MDNKTEEPEAATSKLEPAPVPTNSTQEIIDVQKEDQLNTSIPDQNDCLSLDLFISTGSEIPLILTNAATLLAAKLKNKSNWPQMIEDSFKPDFSTAAEMRELLKRNVNELELRELIMIFVWFFRAARKCNDDSERRFLDRAINDNQKCELISKYYKIFCIKLMAKLHIILSKFAGTDGKTFKQFINDLQHPDKLINSNNPAGYSQIEIQVFGMLIQHLAPIRREFRDVKRTSFVLTKTIGVVLNGNLFDGVPPSRMLKTEKFLFYAFNVCEILC